MPQNNEILTKADRANKTIAYHAVTERPMHISQVITFDKNNPNGVFKRVQCVQRLRNIENIDTDKLDDLEKMILNNLKRWCMIADRELALEKIRKEKFPMYPSRMACLYVSLNVEDAIKWADLFKNYYNREVYSVVKLIVSGNIFTGYADNCWQKDLPKSEHLIRAEKYWRNDEPIQGDKTTCETIVSGKIQVVEILKEYKIGRRLIENN